MRSSVVLPHPDGPTTQMNSPSRMHRSNDSSAATTMSELLKVLETARIVIFVGCGSTGVG